MSSLLLLLMMARIISSWLKLKASAMVCMTSMREPQIFSVTVNSTDACVTSRNTPPMVSYDSYRLTYPRMLYCSIQSEMDASHYVHNSLNRLRIVTFSKKAVEFRDYMPIFVHAKGYYICLFGDTNIVIINEICKYSQRNQP